MNGPDVKTIASERRLGFIKKTNDLAKCLVGQRVFCLNTWYDLFITQETANAEIAPIDIGFVEDEVPDIFFIDLSEFRAEEVYIIVFIMRRRAEFIDMGGKWAAIQLTVHKGEEGLGTAVFE